MRSVGRSSRTPRYGQFRVGDKMVFAHRVAYELTFGEIPEGMQVDHRPNCAKRCVNPEHLRLVTQKQNRENLVGAYRSSKSGVRGVYRVGDRWRASVGHNGRKHNVGKFDTLEEAQEAVRLKRIQLHTHNDLDRAHV